DKLLVGDYVLEAHLSDEPPPRGAQSDHGGASNDSQETMAVDGLDDIQRILFGERPASPAAAPPPSSQNSHGVHVERRPKAKNPLDLFPSTERAHEAPPPIPAASLLDEPAPGHHARRREEPAAGDAIDAVLGIFREREERVSPPQDAPDSPGIASVLRGAG